MDNSDGDSKREDIKIALLASLFALRSAGSDWTTVKKTNKQSDERTQTLAAAA